MTSPARFSEENFQATLFALGADRDKSVFPQLRVAYSAPTRHYHTKAHITECLALLDRFTDLATHPYEVAMAIWFHDAIYDTTRSDNEERSATWASRFLGSVGVAQEKGDRITAMILATKTHESSNADCKLLLDIDLSILGADPETFIAYDQAIRQEYDWVPEEQYTLARRSVLGSFLARPRIYKTAQFFQRYEQQARENLERKISELLTRI